ncbi:MAG: hydrogenase maturation protease [Nitrospira sp.]|nr:hydrogenase maturation protease [Nitrospira sp.]
MQAIRIIGLGNHMRGDDAVGLLAARRLRERVGSRAQVIEAETAGVELLDMMNAADTVLLIDAVCSHRQVPGTIHRLDASAGPIAPGLFPRSTHAIGVGEALELARTLGVLPNKVIVYGIEADKMDIGRPLSPEVTHALHEVVELVLQEIESRVCTNSI